MAKDILITPLDGDIVFNNTAGTGSGAITQDGDNLVISNALGDVLLGDGDADIYIGDGTNNVDIVFEQSGTIKAEDGSSGVTLTIGSSDTTFALGSPISSDLTVGVNDTGHDVTFFGATSGKKMLWDQSADTLVVDGTLDINGDASILSGGVSGTFTVGRNANENMVIFVDDSNTTITGVQDSDTNGAHSFILNRTFLGSGANNFIIQKGGTAQLTLDTNGNATFAGDITLGANHIGRDGDNYIGFETDNLINFRVAGATQVKIGDGSIAPQTDSDVDLGSNSTRFKDAYIDTITTTGAITAGGKIQGTELEGTSLDINGRVDFQAISTSATGTVVRGGFLNPAAEASMVHIPHIINDLAGFNKWGTITTSGLYKTRGGSAGSYTYSNEVATSDFDNGAAFDAHSSTAGSWYSDNGADGNTAGVGVITLEWPNELMYSSYVGIVFGSVSFSPQRVKIEAYQTDAGWQTLCDITDNSENVVLRQITGNSGTGQGTTKLRYTLGGSGNNGYFRIHSLYMANYRAGDNSLTSGGTDLTRGVNFLEKYKDVFLHGQFRPGADTTYDLGSGTYQWRNAYIDGFIDMGTNQLTDTTVGNWNTAYDWGNHGSAGYGTSNLAIGTTSTTALAGNTSIPSISGLAALASPTFTGTPLAPTAAANTNTTQIATTAFVQTELTDLIGGAPGTLDTLNELAAAIDDDASYASTLTTALALKAPKASPTFTGNVSLGNGAITSNGSTFAFDGGSGNEVLISSARDVRIVIDDNSDDTDNTFEIHKHGFGSGNELLTINQSGNATFAGTIGSGAITSTGKIQGTELEGTSLDINGAADISGISTLGDQVHFTAGGSLIKKSNSSWSNATTHDLIYQGWLSNVGDYVYLKAPGNSTTDHGVVLIGDSVIAIGRSDVEEGHIDTDSATAPLSENWFVLNGTQATFTGDVSASGDININNNSQFKGKHTNGSEYGLLTLTSGNQIKVGAYDYTGAGVIFGGGDNTQFLIGSTEAMRLRSTGLEITGDITASGNISASGAIDGASLDINGNADISGNLTGVDALTASGKITGAELEGTSLDINGAANISGNVDLGNSNILTLQGGMNTAGNFDAAKLRLDSTDTVDNTGFHGMRFATSTTTNYGWSLGTNRSSSGRGSLRFYEHNASNAGTERFTLLQDGNVGIGVAAPAAKLHIKKTSAGTTHIDAYASAIIEDTEARLQIIADDGGNNASSILLSNETKHWGINHKGPSSSNRFSIGNATTTGTGADIVSALSEKFTITSGGDVGIGVVAPASKLHVAGTVQVGVDDTGHDVKFFGATSGKYMLWDESANTLKVAGALDINGAADISGNLSLSGTQKKIILGSQLSVSLPAQGTKMRILTLANLTSCRVYMDSSENGYNQPIVLDIFYNSQSSAKPVIHRNNSYQWHQHSNDIRFTCDTSGHIYAEKVSYTTGRTLNIRKVEEFKGTVTILDGSTTATGGGTSDVIEGKFKSIDLTSGLTLDGNTITGVDDSGEFTDDDAHIMTSAAVNDRIQSSIIANTDTQDLSISGQTLSLTNGGSVTLPDTTYSVGDGGLSQNNFTNADHTKLNGIEASATADQSNEEIRTAVEAATDSNVFTDADHTKLNGIEASATADQTQADINGLAITTVGTIGTGVWNGTVITSAKLDSDTAHLSGAQSFTGLKTFTAGIAPSYIKHTISGANAGDYGPGAEILFGISSETTTPGAIYTLRSGLWTLIDANTDNRVDRLCAVAVGNNSSTDGMLIRGCVTLASAFTAGTDVEGVQVYASETAGQATIDAPSDSTDLVRILGYSLNVSSKRMFFNPDSTFLEIA